MHGLEAAEGGATVQLPDEAGLVRLVDALAATVEELHSKGKAAPGSNLSELLTPAVMVLGRVCVASTGVLGATSLDGLRRRTRALTGRCQGFYCAARVVELAAEASGRPASEWTGL